MITLSRIKYWAMIGLQILTAALAALSEVSK